MFNSTRIRSFIISTNQKKKIFQQYQSFASTTTNSNNYNSSSNLKKNTFNYIIGSLVLIGLGGSTYSYYRKKTGGGNLLNGGGSGGTNEIENSDTPRHNHKIIRTLEEATLKLRENQKSFLFQRNNGVLRYDTNQLASNEPIEDTKRDQLFFGVYDGHAGYSTSHLLAKALIPKVKEELDKAYLGIEQYSKFIGQKAKLTELAIQNAFVNLDKDIVYYSVERSLNNEKSTSIDEGILTALSGSCSLLAYIDTLEKDLYVACTGDSRAVIGHKDLETGKWVVLPLSEDQTGRNKKEIERINKEHPGEEVIRAGRVFGGLEPTRAFGDAKYKWDKNTNGLIYSKYFKEKQHVPGGEKFKTPPYVTAKPEITHHKIQSNDKFLVIATDGLWDRLSNNEVVELKNFVLEDENASTHLIRNSLGGADNKILCSLLSIPPPMSRRHRDDITVTVIFFEN
nr:1572_t:CDS:2 [Entrophospora candida]